MPEFSPHELRDALGQVVGSREFLRSEQLRGLLSYLVEAAIQERTDMLKESVIGVEFFGLPSDFDPKRDPVVRMAMRRLRDRLQRYYFGGGATDRIVIALKPGSYAPQFLAKCDNAHERIRIAVLPFEYTPQPAAEEGHAERLRCALHAKLSGNSSFDLVAHDSLSFKHGLSPDIDHLFGHERVRFLVRGACFAQAETLRVCIELVDVDGQRTIWAGNHDQVATAETWTVQDKIAVNVEREVLTSIKRGTTRVSTEPEGSTQRLTILGRHYLAQNNGDSLKKSEAQFLAAIHKEPESANAWAGLSVVQSLMAIFYVKSPEAARRSARFSAERAITFDPTLADSHTAAGLIEVLDTFRPAASQKYFRHALQLNPHDSSARLVHALACLAPLGHLGEAEKELRTLLVSDPLNSKALQSLAVVLYFQRRYEAGAEMARSALDVLPGSAIASFALAKCYDGLGRESDAIAEFRKCEEVMPFLRILKLPAVLGAVYKGRTKWVRPGFLAAIKLLEATNRAPSSMIADVLLRMGEKERGMRWIQRAFRERALRGLYLAVDPAFDSIRLHPECQKLIELLQSSEPGTALQPVIAIRRR
jgi:TolB-like protein/tetratricopeptide (TPR) repeat protein